MLTFDRERWLEQSADTTRCRMFTYDAIPIDLNTALGRLPDLPVTPRASYAVLPPQRMRFDEAFIDGATNSMYLSEATMDGLRNGNFHSRFTVAHELGHLVLRHPGVRSRGLNGVDFRTRAGVPGVARQEAEANFWAAAFLMPRHHVLLCSTPEQLSSSTQTSLAAAKIRFDGVRRSERQEKAMPRVITSRTHAALSALFRDLGVEPQSFKLLPPEADEESHK